MPAPPLVAVLPSMVSLQDLKAHLVQDSTFNGTEAEAAAFAQSMLHYLDKKVMGNTARDVNNVVMVDPDVEFSDFSDNEGGSSGASAAMKVKKRYTMKQSEKDIRFAKKAKGAGKGPGGSQ